MNGYSDVRAFNSLTEASVENPLLYCNYIEENLNVDSAVTYVALEALLRAIEDDSDIESSGSEGMIDLRSMSDNKSVSRLRDLIRDRTFMIDLYKTQRGLSHEILYFTPYDRQAKRTWQTGHWSFKTSKGWVVLDYLTESLIVKRP